MDGPVEFGAIEWIATLGVTMRLLMIAPLFLLLSPILGEETAAPALAAHALCGDDTIASGDARILEGYGGGGFPVTTSKPAAQAFFDNGMQLSHAFAHKAGIAAFAEASRLDALCAMCVWGEAWASGPTINYSIDAATQVRLGKKVDAAERLAATGPDKEQRMIAALALRYQHGGGNGSGDLAFARAMDALARAWPDDDEIATITADAWMIPAALRGNRDNLPRAVELLEAVLKRHPDYTPAIHFYIHATEMSGFPARAEPYANRLAALAPAASHLVHMPSHTYYRVGRYQDAVEANVRAVAIGVDNARRLKLPQPDGVWQLPYHPHNVQFGVGGALMSGDAPDALALSGPMIAAATHGPKPSIYVQMAGATAYFAEGRFADPAHMLALPDPGGALPFMRAYWHYARGEAQARLGNANAVRTEAAAIPERFDHVGRADYTAYAAGVAEIARLVLIGRAAMLDHQPGMAIKAYHAAAKIEESSLFADQSDPPSWWYPVRRSLASALLAAGKPDEALAQANAALKRRPRDPVTLAIRADIETALGKIADAARDRAAASGWRGEKSAFTPALI
jgi:tetratricopeptide (TPR) repeat protein